jgi:hypothetical protein
VGAWGARELGRHPFLFPLLILENQRPRMTLLRFLCGTLRVKLLLLLIT